MQVAHQISFIEDETDIADMFAKYRLRFEILRDFNVEQSFLFTQILEFHVFKCNRNEEI